VEPKYVIWYEIITSYDGEIYLKNTADPFWLGTQIDRIEVTDTRVRVLGPDGGTVLQISRDRDGTTHG
jgi:hypothetical protein